MCIQYMRGICGNKEKFGIPVILLALSSSPLLLLFFLASTMLGLHLSFAFWQQTILEPRYHRQEHHRDITALEPPHQHQLQHQHHSHYAFIVQCDFHQKSPSHFPASGANLGLIIS